MFFMLNTVLRYTIRFASVPMVPIFSKAYHLLVSVLPHPSSPSNAQKKIDLQSSLFCAGSSLIRYWLALKE